MSDTSHRHNTGTVTVATEDGKVVLTWTYQGFAGPGDRIMKMDPDQAADLGSELMEVSRHA